MATPETRAEVTRRLGASPERIFGAFASADLVSRWLSPSPDIVLQVLAYDFRVNGAYRFEYLVPSGAVMHVHGIFRSITPPRELIFSWVIEPPDEHSGINSEVRVSITETAGGSLLSIVHERLDRAGAAERHRGGWLGALECLESLLRGRTQE